MPIRNYTSSVPASRSIAEIEAKLVTNGARNFVKMYEENKRLSGIVFEIPMGDGRNAVIQLPARVEQLYKLMEKDRRSFHISVNALPADVYDQAERTAWKNILEWVDIQLVLIHLEQVEFMQVFLPYVYDHKKKTNYYELVRDSGFKMLPAPKE